MLTCGPQPTMFQFDALWRTLPLLNFHYEVHHHHHHQLLER